MKSPRTIVVKTLMNPDEFLAFDAECVNADVPHSKQLRDLAKNWIAQRNSSRRAPTREWSFPVQNVAMLLPSRAHYGSRMRV